MSCCSKTLKPIPPTLSSLHTLNPLTPTLFHFPFIGSKVLSHKAPPTMVASSPLSLNARASLCFSFVNHF